SSPLPNSPGWSLLLTESLLLAETIRPRNHRAIPNAPIAPQRRGPQQSPSPTEDAEWHPASEPRGGRARSYKCLHELLLRYSSTNVTLLLSFMVVIPAFIFARPLSRSVAIPSSRAARLISEVGRRSTIISRMRSVRSINSQIAVRP